MDNLSYLHLVIAHQEKPEPAKSENLGASWDKHAWDEVFEDPKRAKKPKTDKSK